MQGEYQYPFSASKEEVEAVMNESDLAFEYHYNNVLGVKNVNKYLTEWGKDGWRVHTIIWEFPPPHLSKMEPRAHILMERVSVA